MGKKSDEGIPLKNNAYHVTSPQGDRCFTMFLLAFKMVLCWKKGLALDSVGKDLLR